MWLRTRGVYVFRPRPFSSQYFESRLLCCLRLERSTSIYGCIFLQQKGWHTLAQVDEFGADDGDLVPKRATGEAAACWGNSMIKHNNSSYIECTYLTHSTYVYAHSNEHNLVKLLLVGRYSLNGRRKGWPAVRQS